ncbi:MAG: hypothetical protein DMG24_06790 [Acidobacteria bacterium]|nr:MAG: hypothetical protein DMG24_06790 [Acidobacteriota bacterium]
MPRIRNSDDELFVTQLSNPSFLGQCVEELKQRSAHGDSANHIQTLNAEVDGLRCKRERVIDGYVDGTIERQERDRRLTTIDHDIQVAQDILNRAVRTASMDTAKLIEAFAPLGESRMYSVSVG